MTVSEIAKSLVEYCQAGKFDDAYEALFSADARSIEPDGKTADGLEAVKAKGEEFSREFEIRSSTVKGPFVAGNNFAVHFAIELFQKSNGQTFPMEEIGFYTVRDGKVVEERFLYAE